MIRDATTSELGDVPHVIFVGFARRNRARHSVLAAFEAAYAESAAVELIFVRKASGGLHSCCDG